jgi:hypothetical protein
MNKTTNKTKSNLKNRINRLIPLNRLFVSSKKEKNNSNSVSENLSITDNNKNVSTFKQFTSKANTYQHENNKNKNDNEYKNHANIQKPSNGSNNIKNNGESLQDFRELVQIEYIYKKNNILLDGLNTIFIAETYLKTLPDYLPNELKRRTVLDIINHNGISTDKLLKDGEERKKILNTFLQKFSQTTEKLIREYENEIQKLSESIQAKEKAILERKKLQAEQTGLIDYEVQRLEKTINFLQGESK